MTTLVWFRNDLRVADNPALHDACDRGGTEAVIAVYLVSAEQAQEHNEGAPRLAFVHETLLTLRHSLEALRIPLWIDAAPKFDDAPAALMAIARRCGAQTLYFNGEYPLNEARRDKQVFEACNSAGIDCQIRHGDLILPPGRVLTKEDRPYSVYTPFKRRWLERVSPSELEPLPVPAPVSHPTSTEIPEPRALRLLPSINPNPDWPAGEVAATGRLDDFIDSRIARYGGDRDYPGKAATSRLSPYLSVGAISARTCYQRAASVSTTEREPWLNELIWREFYRHVVSLYPHVSRGLSFKRALDSLPWRHDPEALAAWKAGQTGYPLVDAGMRQLAETGFMHNRLRMVTAMFLTKHLLIHWREGERHFMQHLRDGDFASNNGGWQWSASTGTDSAPYFRIFNPSSQAKKFDPDSAFIRRWIPEFDTERYPSAIVEHASARQRALDFFKAG